MAMVCFAALAGGLSIQRHRCFGSQEDLALLTRLNYAQLKASACFEDIDFRELRGLKRAVMD